ncbi:hypothetical protein AVEN_201511-1 [Araneus ventricosus]|uniref:DUF4817 domain-containing protein n=1 Tax=Araneus ventricosus TaxID=182803 RepID=A0A4Y2PVK5_ARAVE|nr:hypothetical protein AVEN_201511-1 [Araneus ventricosus]
MASPQEQAQVEAWFIEFKSATQKDGALPHWNLEVRKVLDEKFPCRWIGKGAPTPWPLRSPDIAPSDFFLWGYVKNFVYEFP